MDFKDTVGSILLIPAVHQLLLAVVPGGPCQLLEADLDGGHVGEGHAAPALLLVLDLNRSELVRTQQTPERADLGDVAQVHRAIAGGGGGAAESERVKIPF